MAGGSGRQPSGPRRPLASGEGGAELQQRVSDQLADLDMIQRLEEFRIAAGRRYLTTKARTRPTRVLRGLRHRRGEPEPAGSSRANSAPAQHRRPDGGGARRLGDGPPRLGSATGRVTRPTWKRLLEVARLADPDPWRSQLRQLMGQEDLNALRKLADPPDIAALPAQSLQLMGNALIFGGDAPACVAWLRKRSDNIPATP